MSPELLDSSPQPPNMELDSNTTTEKAPTNAGFSHVLLDPRPPDEPRNQENAGLDSRHDSSAAGMEDDSKKAAESAENTAVPNNHAPPPRPPQPRPAEEQHLHPGSSTEEEDSSGHEPELSPARHGELARRDDDEEDELDGEEPRLKKEKRLAMNRASARERRRRKRMHTEELEHRVIQLSRQCVALQKTNEGLQLYVAKLESDLAQANAAVTVLSAKTQDQPRPAHQPRPVQDPVASLLAQAQSQPGGRAGALAETIQEQERVRALLNLLQQQQQETSLMAAAPASQSAASRLLGGAAGASKLVAQKEDDLERQALLELLNKRQQPQAPQPRDPMEELSSLVANSRAAPAASQLDPTLAALLGGRSAAAAPPPTGPPMDATLASLLGGAAPPRAAAPQLPGGNDPIASYLSSLQQQPRGGAATRMVSNVVVAVE